MTTETALALLTILEVILLVSIALTGSFVGVYSLAVGD